MQLSKGLVRRTVAIGALSFTGCMAGAGDPEVSESGLLATVDRVALLADRGVAKVQNAVLPGSITNDRNVRFGSIGSDIFRAHGDRGTPSG